MYVFTYVHTYIAYRYICNTISISVNTIATGFAIAGKEICYNYRTIATLWLVSCDTEPLLHSLIKDNIVLTTGYLSIYWQQHSWSCFQNSQIMYGNAKSASNPYHHTQISTRTQIKQTHDKPKRYMHIIFL